ncbi:hypothetical protein E1K63_11755 [Salmonella enterica subsp. enterica serovar Oranienburg]|nr:hypothetical protein [Salmonella enterica subsp. enterica serovar Oranienburg]
MTDRLSKTIRLPQQRNVRKGDVFTAEEWVALKALFPDETDSHVVQMALKEFAKNAPEMLLRKKKEELNMLRNSVDVLFKTMEK